MRHRYRSTDKAAQIVRTEAHNGRHCIIAGVNHATQWKRPVSKKTAAELLVRDDEARKDGKSQVLTDDQRDLLTARTGEGYEQLAKSKTKAPADPFSRQKGETVEQYVARINTLIA